MMKNIYSRACMSKTDFVSQSLWVYWLPEKKILWGFQNINLEPFGNSGTIIWLTQ